MTASHRGKHFTPHFAGLIEPLLPPAKPRRFRYPGRMPISNRLALTGILFVLRSGIPREMLPQELGCGCGMSCWRRLRDWTEAGVWSELQRVLLSQQRQADQIDWSRAVIDSSAVRAVFGGRRRDRTRPIAVESKLARQLPERLQGDRADDSEDHRRILRW